MALSFWSFGHVGAQPRARRRGTTWVRDPSFGCPLKVFTVDHFHAIDPLRVATVDHFRAFSPLKVSTVNHFHAFGPVKVVTLDNFRAIGPLKVATVTLARRPEPLPGNHSSDLAALARVRPDGPDAEKPSHTALRAPPNSSGRPRLWDRDLFRSRCHTGHMVGVL